ncbi:hypothetical protein ACWOAQ_05150 [Helcococcus kunzii]
MKFLLMGIIGTIIAAILRLIFRNMNFKSTLVSTIILLMTMLVLGFKFELGDNISFIFGAIFAGLLIATYEKYRNLKKIK